MAYDIVGSEALVGEDMEGDDILGDDILGDDILGDDILGDEMDGDDIVGMRIRRRRRKGAARNRMMQQALIEKRVSQGTYLSSRPPTKGREQLLGFVFLGVPAGGTTDVISRPQTIFRGERLVVPSALVGVFFSIDDIKVGNVSQFVASGPVPAVTFSETGVGVRLAMDTAQPAMDVALRVTNLDAVAHDFRASLIGGSVQ